MTPRCGERGRTQYARSTLAAHAADRLPSKAFRATGNARLVARNGLG